MSTQSGKNDGPAGKGSGDSAKGGKPKRTVAASAAKPGRDETTVEIGSADETKTDLPQVGDADKKSGPAGKADADAKDTAEGSKASTESKDTKESGGKAEPETKADGSIPAVKESAASGGSSWTEPAEPAGSVSAGRADRGAAEAPAANSSGPASRPASGGPSGPAGTKPPGSGPGFTEPAAAQSSPSGQAGQSGQGFARTVLKNKLTRPAGSGGTSGKTARKAQLQLARLEPWSVMKFSFVMSLVCFLVLLVAVIVLYAILSGLGVFSTISETVTDLTRNPGESEGGLDAGSWFSFFRVFGYTFLVGALNVMLITALSTVGAVIYNLAADLVGGIEVTLKEAE